MSKLDHEPFEAAVGIDTGKHYKEIDQIIHDAKINEGYNINPIGRYAVGLLMSEKTGLQGIANRHGSIYPLPRDVKDIITARLESCNNKTDNEPLAVLLHYNTDNPEIIGEQLNRALEPIAEGIDGVQVNHLDFGQQAENLAVFKSEHPDIPIIFQAHQKLISGHTPVELANRLAELQDIIDYVWLDLSAGNDINFERKVLEPYIQAIKNSTPALMMGVAGGLHTYNLKKQVQPLLKETPNLSWDAQSGVQLFIHGDKLFDPYTATVFLSASEIVRTHATKE